MRENNIVDGYHSPLSLSALTVCTSDSWWSSGTCVLARLGLSVPQTTWTWLSSGTSVEPPSSSARFKTFPFVSSFHLTFSLPSPHSWTAYLHLLQMYPPPPLRRRRVSPLPLLHGDEEPLFLAAASRLRLRRRPPCPGGDIIAKRFS